MGCGGFGGAASLQSVVDARDFKRVAEFCEDRELQVGGVSMMSDWPYALHMLGYLINNDLDSARYLWRRTPASVKETNQELCVAWRITQAMWNQDYVALHTTLREHEWSSEAAGAAEFLRDEIQTRTLNLLARAYTTLRLSDAAIFLGLTEPETAAMVQNLGWELHTATGMLTVANITPEADRGTTPAQLQQLTEYAILQAGVGCMELSRNKTYVVHLEG